ncbi:MAG: 6-phosphogluconolactonase [Lysobacteraceae bacterium]|nr:MAG: 6-phosphogluconolactonase [Xanthomonadaceae bacterium]
MRLKTYDSRESLVADLSRHLVDSINRQLAHQPTASMIVPGGSSPQPVLAHLALQTLPYSRLELTLSDERCVDSRDRMSNEAMLRKTFLHGPASATHFIALYNSRMSPQQSIEQTEGKLASLHWPVAATLLGIGTDGHTASLFASDPNIDSLFETGQRLAVALPRTQPTARITLTPTALLNTEVLIFLGFGKEKRAVFEQLLNDTHPHLPAARLISMCAVPVYFYWAP